MLQIFLYSFPIYRARTAIVSYSQLPTLLRQLNRCDILIVDCIPFSCGSFQHHEQYVHPFLVSASSFNVLWILRTPNMNNVTNLYNLPYFVTVSFTELAFIASNIHLLEAFRIQHMFNNHFSKIPPNTSEKFHDFLTDNSKTINYRASKHNLVSIS